jgi:hypothetical protein
MLNLMPPAARGARCEKKNPLDPLQKLLIKGSHLLHLDSTAGQTMTAFDLFKKRLSWIIGSLGVPIS